MHNVYCSYCILTIACSRPTIKSGHGVCVSLKYFLSYLFYLQCDDNLSDLIIQMSWSNAETFASSRQSSRSVCASEVPYLSRKNYKTVPFHSTPTGVPFWWPCHVIATTIIRAGKRLLTCCRRLPLTFSGCSLLERDISASWCFHIAASNSTNQIISIIWTQNARTSGWL